MALEFLLPKDERSIIKVIGVGGGGSNAVAHMYRQGIVGVDFAICNTDNQSMELNPVPVKIQLGPDLTEGMGAGSLPHVGKEACLESLDDVKSFLFENTKMVFITAGMGGGTGTGAAPIIAQAAKELGILTVGIVTTPFTFEGKKRFGFAEEGLEELKRNVDALIVISNDKLKEIFKNMTLSEAFSQADNILTTAAKGIAEIITVPGYINVDFKDVNTVMRDSGVAIMGTGRAEGEHRARKAVEAALNSPLLEDNDIRGAQHILLNITSGNKEVTMEEIAEITDYVQDEAGYGTNMIWGNCHDESLGDQICVTIIATGFDHVEKKQAQQVERTEKMALNDDRYNNETVQNEMFYNNAVAEPEFVSYASSEDDEFRLRTEKTNKVAAVTFQESHMSGEDKEKHNEDKRRHIEQEQKRRDQFRNRMVRLTNPQNVSDLEAVPAYVRRKVMLDDVSASHEMKYSRMTFTVDDEPEFRLDNAYLHDNVD